MDEISLNSLNCLKSAPILNHWQTLKLIREISPKIISSDWLTIGIMALSDFEAKKALKTIIKRYSFNEFGELTGLKAKGSVFLKGNQKTGEVYIRSENGLGVGILLTCQYDDLSKDSITYGPFPLNFFI
tara:strand:- start:1291 stop:1677 length:387 start_codon:yes stop_codon:yes gene_type:complete